MNSKDQADFLKQPRLDIGNRHKKKRLEISGRWGEDHDIEAIEPLTAVIQNQQDDPDIRLVSVQTLGFINDPQSVAALASILANPAMAEFHATAIIALGTIGNDQAAQALIASWEHVAGAKHHNIQQSLVQLESAMVTDLLIEALGHSSPTVRAQTTATLTQLEDITPRLITALDHENSQVRNGVQTHLVQVGKPIVPSLTAVLSQPNERIQTGATETLVQIGAPAIENLITLAGGKDEQTARIAIDILIKIGEPAVKPLIIAAPAHPQAINILLEMKDATQAAFQNASEADISLLITILSFADEDLNQIATAKLIRIGEPTIPTLISLLAEGDNNQRQSATTILTELGDKAIEPLVDSLDDATIRSQIENLLTQAGEATLLPLFNKLNDPECTEQDLIIEIMCASTGTDRLTVAITLYHMLIPVWANIFSSNVSLALMLIRQANGSTTYIDQMHQADINEENIQLAYDMHGNLIELNSDHAVAQLQTLATIAPEFALPHYWLGQWYFVKQKDTKKAIHEFELATQSQEFLLKDRQAKSFWWLGVCHTESPPYYDYEKSLSCFQQTIDLGWDDPLVFQAIQISAQQTATKCLNNGNSSLFLQALRKKEESLRAFVEREPNQEEFIQLLHAAQSVLAKTEKDYEELGETKAFTQLQIGFLIGQAHNMRQNGQSQEAITLLRNLSNEHPDNININIALGEIYLQSGQVSQGLAELKKYLQPQPETVGHIFILLQKNAVTILDETLNKLKSRRLFAEAMAILADLETLVTPVSAIPDQQDRKAFGTLLNTLAIRYMQIAERDNPWVSHAHQRSIACIESAYTLSPTQNIIEPLSFIYACIGEYLASQGQPQEALEYVKKAVNATPEQSGLWWLMSMIYRDLRNTDNSMFCAIKAAEMGNPEAISMLRSIQ